MSLADFMPMERKQLFFVGEYGLKRPLPPFGYVSGKIIQRTMPDGQMESPICPICKQPCGMVYDGGGYVDPEAQEFWEGIDKEMNSFDMGCQTFEGEMIKCHWSRYGTGNCIGCRAKIWHDFVGGYVKLNNKNRYVDWKYYFLPIKVIHE